jgi:hypothetical protein
MGNNVQVTMAVYSGSPPIRPIHREDSHPEEDGCFNKEADKVTLVNETWSDSNLTNDYPIGYVFKRLICRNCRGVKFEVLATDDYETSAKCCGCGMYYIVHTG